MEPIDVIIPTRSPATALTLLLRQIRKTAGCPHCIVLTGADASASVNRNLGLSKSSGEMVAMVDDDMVFPETSQGWLRILVEALQRPEVVMVSSQLLKPDGSFAYMTGLNDCDRPAKLEGSTVVPTRRLLTACCAFKPHGLRFDEGYIGSGFEDVDFCNQLAALRPDGLFLVCHASRAIHRNERKEQLGKNWQHNEARYKSKWGIA